jgi:hypothetical protein
VKGFRLSRTPMGRRDNEFRFIARMHRPGRVRNLDTERCRGRTRRRTGPSDRGSVRPGGVRDCRTVRVADEFKRGKRLPSPLILPS